MSPLTEQLAAILMRPVPRESRERAALHLLDWAGCVWAGSRTQTGETLLRWGHAGDTGTHAAIGLGGRAADVALIVNGGLGNILEMDDLHRTAILHPGPVVIPAALLAAQAAQVSGATLLDAIVCGYEAIIRVGASLGSGHYQHWHNTGTAGPFGAAAAVGHILGADQSQLVHAMGNAGTQSAGLWQTRLEPSMSKQLHTGRASHAGWVAAQMAMAGFTGPTQILEGAHGLYAATCPNPDPDKVIAQAGDHWQIHDVSFKPWPACRHAHPTIDAAMQLFSQCQTDQIESLCVHTYDEAIRFCDNAMPITELQARFSLQHLVAVVMTRGRVGMDDCLPAAIGDAAIAQWRARVSVVTDSQLSQAFPEHYGARLQATMRDGSSIVVECSDALGDPVWPLSVQQVQEKSRTLQTWALRSEACISNLAGQIMQLPDAPDLSGLHRALFHQEHSRD